MKTQCPHCQSSFNAPDNCVGKKAKCPKCKQPFVITEKTATKIQSSEVLQANHEENELATQSENTDQNNAVPPQRISKERPAKAETIINVNTDMTKGINGLGVAALVLGIITCLTCWIPFVGCFVIPIGILGLLFGVIGFFAAIIGRRSGIGMPLSGIIVCGISVTVSIVMTGATGLAIEDTLKTKSIDAIGSQSNNISASNVSGRKQQGNDASYEKENYKRHIEIYEFSAQYFETFRGRTPGVQFKIRNNGNRVLGKIKIIVYFKDSSNRIIAEEDFYPVNTNSYSPDFNKPLRPNYIWQMPEGNFLSAESIPSEWQEGNVTYIIEEIEFVQ